MEIGEGSPWVGVLVGALFTLILLPMLLTSLANLLRHLSHGFHSLLGSRGKWTHASRPSRGIREDLFHVMLFGFFGIMSSLIFLVSLVNYLPIIGTWPPLATLLPLTIDETKLQQGLARGVEEQDAGLIRLALTLGADARNPGENQSFLPQVRAPAIRLLLMEHGASPDGLRHQQAPLLQAVEMRDFELYDWLLHAGANPDPRWRDPNEHFITLLAQSDPALPDEWLATLLRHGPDLNRRVPAGPAVLDVMTLERLRPEWQAILREAGARHGLLLDRGAALPPDHPAIRHVRQWLEARATQGWVEGDERWELPGASATGIYYFLPVKDIRLEGRIEGNEALVQASGPAGGGPERTTVIGLRWIQPEAALPVAEADPAERMQGNGSWRITGFWLDERDPQPSAAEEPSGP